MSPEEHDALDMLEVLDSGGVPLPQELRIALQEAGLIEPAGEGYRLTMRGRLQLENLRSLARGMPVSVG